MDGTKLWLQPYTHTHLLILAALFVCGCVAICWSVYISITLSDCQAVYLAVKLSVHVILAALLVWVSAALPACL